ncbi:MAG: MFS transporter [Pseudomonadota bacterium]
MSDSPVTDKPSSSSGRPAGYWFEDMPLTRAHWVAGAVLFFAFVIEAWEMMIIILSASAISNAFDADAQTIGGLISAIFLGMIPGSLLWGKLSNIIGRKKSLLFSIGSYGAFPLLSAMAPNLEALWLIRFFAGVCLSGALVVTFPLFTELLPVKWRGRGTVFLSAGWPVGTLLAVAVTALFADAGWRWVLGFSTVVSLWALPVFFLVPESAYWLAGKGRGEDARSVIQKLSGREMAPDALAEADGDASAMPFVGIFRRRILCITALSTVVNFCFSWGYWGMTSWLPSLLARKGLSAPEGLGFIALSALFMFPGYITASYLTGIYGRKKVMVSFVAMATLAGYGFANSASITQLYAWNFALSFFSLGAWGIWNTWMGEIYDTANRASGAAWGVMLQRVANTIAPIAIGAILVTGSFTTTVAFISSFLAVTFVTALFLPETEGKRLT